jgi:hypothetical protein
MVFFRFFLLFFLVLPIKTLLAQDMLTFLDGALSFQRPEEVTLWEERPRSTTDPNFQNFWHGRIQLRVEIYDEEALLARPPTLFNQAVYDLISNKGYLSRNDLVGLFNTMSEFVLLPIEPRIEVIRSYKLLQINGITIGESIFHANAIDLLARGNFGYIICLIVENKIVTISLSLFTGEENNPIRQLDGYSVIRNGALHWIDDRSRTSFYEHLSSNRYKEMPFILQQLREAYDAILQTLEIRQNGNNRMIGIDIISPPFEFQRTHATNRIVHLREDTDDGSPTILTISEGTSVQLVTVSRFTRTMLGITMPWVLVMTRDGIVGWVFSGYLDEDMFETSLIESENAGVNVNLAGSINSNNEIILNNTEDVFVKESERTWFCFLLLLIPLIAVAIFLVIKKRK